MYDREQDILSKALRAGRRTYFFDVKSTKAGDYYLTITESKKFTNDDGSFHFKKHKIYLYKEDFNRFLEGLNEAIDVVKKDLMPDYDYDEFTRRNEEYEARMREEGEQGGSSSDDNMEW